MITKHRYDVDTFFEIYSIILGIMTNQDDYQRVTIRIPPELHTDLRRAAGRSERSINAEIITRLAKTLEDDASESMLAQGDPYLTIAKAAQDMEKMAQAILSASVTAAASAEKLSGRHTIPTRQDALKTMSNSERELLSLFNDIPVMKRAAVMSSMVSLHDALVDNK